MEQGREAGGKPRRRFFWQLRKKLTKKVIKSMQKTKLEKKMHLSSLHLLKHNPSRLQLPLSLLVLAQPLEPGGSDRVERRRRHGLRGGDLDEDPFVAFVVILLFLITLIVIDL